MRSASSSIYSNRRSSSASSSIEDDDQLTWLKPPGGISLNPIVINGEFSEANPYLHRSVDVDVIRSKDFEERLHLQVSKYESFCRKILTRLDELRIGLNLSNEMESLLFHEFHSFKELNNHFLRQLELSMNYIAFTRMLKIHLSKYYTIFQSFWNNYKSLTIGFDKLKQTQWKKLKKLHLDDDLFQYPINYILYYQKINIEFNLDLNLTIDTTAVNTTLQDINLLITNFKNKYNHLEFLQIQLLQFPFDSCIKELMKLTASFKKVDECIYDDDDIHHQQEQQQQQKSVQLTPRAKKFLSNSTKTMHELFEWKLQIVNDKVHMIWVTLVDHLQKLIQTMNEINNVIKLYESSLEMNNKYIITNFQYWTNLAKVLLLKLPIYTSLIDKFVPLFNQFFILSLIKILKSFGNDHHSSSSSMDIITNYKIQWQCNKEMILSAAHNDERVLKYNFNSLKTDVVPMTPNSSFVINKFFPI